MSTESKDNGKKIIEFMKEQAEKAKEEKPKKELTKNQKWIAMVLPVLLACGLYAINTRIQKPIPEKFETVTHDSIDSFWWENDSTFTDEKDHTVTVVYNDEGLLEFIIGNEPAYFASPEEYLSEDSQMIYTCDGGTNIIYHSGDPARIEIVQGEHVGVYEAQ